MRLAILLLAVAGCGGGAKTLRLPVFDSALGSSVVVDDLQTVKAEVQQEYGTLQSTTIDHQRYHRKVVELEGALIVRIEVRYELDQKIEISGEMNPVKTEGPLVGKAYVLWRDRDALEAEHLDGSPITAEERGALNAEFHDLGTTARGEAFVTGRTWKPDEIVPIPDEVITELGNGIEDADVREATMTWVGSDGDRTTLRAFLSLTTADGFDVQSTQDGTFDRKTGRALSSKGTAIVRGKVGPYQVVQTIETVKTTEPE